VCIESAAGAVRLQLAGSLSMVDQVSWGSGAGEGARMLTAGEVNVNAEIVTRTDRRSLRQGTAQLATVLCL
jgi:hypothetical protein